MTAANLRWFEVNVSNILVHLGPMVAGRIASLCGHCTKSSALMTYATWKQGL